MRHTVVFIIPRCWVFFGILFFPCMKHGETLPEASLPYQRKKINSPPRNWSEWPGFRVSTTSPPYGDGDLELDEATAGLGVMPELSSVSSPPTASLPASAPFLPFRKLPLGHGEDRQDMSVNFDRDKQLRLQVPGVVQESASTGEVTGAGTIHVGSLPHPSVLQEKLRGIRRIISGSLPSRLHLVPLHSQQMGYTISFHANNPSFAERRSAGEPSVADGEARVAHGPAPGPSSSGTSPSAGATIPLSTVVSERGKAALANAAVRVAAAQMYIPAAAQLSAALDAALPAFSSFTVDISWPFPRTAKLTRGAILGSGSAAVVVAALEEGHQEVALRLLQVKGQARTSTLLGTYADEARATILKIVHLLGPANTQHALACGLAFPLYSGIIGTVGGGPAPQWALEDDTAPQFYTFVVAYPRATCSLADVLLSVRLPFSSIQSIIKQMILSVANLHSMGIVHGDIKPDNFLVTGAGDILLTDFDGAVKTQDGKGCNYLGTAKFRDLSTTEAVYRRASQGGNIDCSEERDTWALGISLYFVVCGEPPFNLLWVPVLKVRDTLRAAANNNESVSFTRCRHSGEKGFTDIKMALSAFLRHEPSARVLPKNAVRTWPMFQQP
ncbi:hypothetical protein BESB_037730 [Besnoitia besnoiti]|uniref:Protein kinase domain-containing protein n=1 Tax=Besnoitia besnoiti TaxID=94643 RepID=A0A2A9MH69_BESBE|nr:hypothetical protein BESB_037730 [Besnoitia besnoiti]PFH37315.1 hypothetical protein BESB_037730 [Besnoitia besnoiti]